MKNCRPAAQCLQGVLSCHSLGQKQKTVQLWGNTELARGEQTTASSTISELFRHGSGALCNLWGEGGEKPLKLTQLSQVMGNSERGCSCSPHPCPTCPTAQDMKRFQSQQQSAGPRLLLKYIYIYSITTIIFDMPGGTPKMGREAERCAQGIARCGICFLWLKGKPNWKANPPTISRHKNCAPHIVSSLGRNRSNPLNISPSGHSSSNWPEGDIPNHKLNIYAFVLKLFPSNQTKSTPL